MPRVREAAQPELEQALRRAVRGAVSFDVKTRALHATDASNYRQVPLAVVTPYDVDDLVAAVGACRDHEVPVTMRGGGTSVAGNAIGPGVVIDTSRHLTRIVAIDPVRRTATVEPGVVLDHLNDAAAVHGLRFAADPSTHTHCTIGGMLGNNACGAHSVAWGKTSDHVESLEVLLYDGARMTVEATPPAQLRALAQHSGRSAEVYRALDALVQDNLAVLRTSFPALPRRVSGYALDALLPEAGFDLPRALVGTEGTCVVVLRAVLRLVPVPAATALVVAGFADDAAAADAVPHLLHLEPLALEGLDRELVDTYIRSRPGGAGAAARLPPGAGWLFVEVTGGTPGEARDRGDDLADALSTAPGFTSAVVVPDPGEQRLLWRIREEGAGLATRLPDGSEAAPGWEDAAVPPVRLGDYLRALRALLARHGLRGVSYGHFGDGCVHTRIDFDLLSAAGRERFGEFVEQAADLVVSYGGSLSGEHGDGRARSALLTRMYSAEVLDLFAQFKAIWDPCDRLNPGVLVRPRRVDADLRVQRAARPVTDVAFGYTADGGDFAKAVRRCVGVGRCRAETGGVMCPSYRVTAQEEHSTRGRAHLLLEMLEGDVVTDGWRSPEVREALDLCLSCKGCASDCPVSVDVSTYKAEFLHRYYRHRLRPASHYSMGFLPLWASLAARAPGIVNSLTRDPAAGRLVRRLAGVAQQRPIPQFVSPTFTEWFRTWPGRRSAGASGGDGDGRVDVVVWPDTFTNYLDPEVGKAAVRVLASAGVGVVVPRRQVCCGLTWVSTGQLGVARRVISRSLDTIGPLMRSDAWIVGLEPSCTATLRSDVPELFPDHEVALWLRSRVLTFAEALDRVDPARWAPQVRATSISQTHCHQHAVLGIDADLRVMHRLGIDNSVIDSGCCGLAGNFGFERGHLQVSLAVAERVLLPAVRSAPSSTVVLADGFSCRTQIAHGTGRRSLHLAQLIDSAIK